MNATLCGNGYSGAGYAPGKAGREPADFRHARGRPLSETAPRPDRARSAVASLSPAVNYLDLARLALPEIIVVVTALIVFSLGLAPRRPRGVCAGVAAAGLLFAAASVLRLAGARDAPARDAGDLAAQFPFQGRSA